MSKRSCRAASGPVESRKTHKPSTTAQNIIPFPIHTIREEDQKALASAVTRQLATGYLAHLFSQVWDYGPGFYVFKIFHLPGQSWGKESRLRTIKKTSQSSMSVKKRHLISSHELERFKL